MGAEILPDLLPNSQVVPLSGIGHMPMAEAPQKKRKGISEVSASPLSFPVLKRTAEKSLFEGDP